MGTVVEAARKELTCAICLEMMNVPKSLPCLHSYCDSCILDYIKKNITFSKYTVTFWYLCPVCRFKVEFKLPQNSSRYTITTQHLRSNPVLKSLIDAFHADGNVRKCKGHDKVLEFFCEDHEEILCSSCAVLDHRKCRWVIAIGDAAERRRNIGKNLVKNFSDQTTFLRNIETFLKTQQQCIEKETACAKQKVHADYDNLHKIITQHKTLILSEINWQKVLADTLTGSLLLDCQKKLEKVQIETEELQLSHDGNNDIEYLIQLEKSKTEMTLLQEELRKIGDGVSNHEFRFMENEKIKGMVNQSLKSSNIFGYFKRTVSKHSFIPPKLDRLISLPLKEILSVENTAVFDTSGSGYVRENSLITGIACFENGNVLLSDARNRRLLLYDCNYEFLYRLKLKFTPMDVVKVNNNMAAVSSSDVRKIRMIRLYDERVALGCTIDTEEICVSLSCYKNSIVACSKVQVFVYAPKNDVYDLINTFDLKQDQYMNLQQLTSVAVDEPSGHILLTVTGHSKSSVLCLDMSGKILFSVSEDQLNEVNGLHTCGNHLFVFSPNSVFLLNKDKKIVETVMQEDNYIVAVSMDFDGKKMIVSKRTGGTQGAALSIYSIDWM